MKTTRKITPVMARTKSDRCLIDSAGVERGSKMLGIGWSPGGLAAHSRAARRTPVRMTRIPVTRAATAFHCVLCLFVMVVKVFPRSAPSHASSGQSWLLEILGVVAHQPHLNLATDSIPAGAPCSPIDALLPPSFIFFNWRRFRQVGRLRNWAWSEATVMGLTVSSKPRLSRCSFL